MIMMTKGGNVINIKNDKTEVSLAAGASQKKYDKKMEDMVEK